MGPLDLVKLTALMERTSGSADVTIGLIDGPVAATHPDLDAERLRVIPGPSGSACADVASPACLHGTFVAGILAAGRTSPAPAICPGCTLVVRPIFSDRTSGSDRMPSATPKELAAAVLDCIDAGARIINLSLALAGPSTKSEPSVDAALDRAVRQGVIVVAAAGNQGTLAGSAITRHRWVIPVVACDGRGRPIAESNLGGSIGKRGVSAPGEGITSLGAEGAPLTLGGTSVAVPFVTGTAALLWSAFPSASAAEIRLAITAAPARRRSVVPPLLDADAAYRRLSGAPAPIRVRLPGFLSDTDIGLGDAIKRATASIGIRPCGGCARRAAALNGWMVFTRRHQK